MTHQIRLAAAPGPREKRPIAEEFVKRASRLEERGHTDAALDLIYDNIDGLLKGARFGEVDLILQRIDVASLSVNILLGILTATLPACRKLPARPKLVEMAESVLRLRGEWEDNLLLGLEG